MIIGLLLEWRVAFVVVFLKSGGVDPRDIYELIVLRNFTTLVE